MAKRGRPANTATAQTRSVSARASLRPSRLSTSDGRSPFHFDHKTHTKAAPGQRASADRQTYIERPGAVERSAVQQGYIERDGAPEIVDGRLAEVGNIAETFEDRRAFWNDVERQERKNGRVQLSIIAALPCELSPAGRLAVLQSFVASEFESRNLPFHGVIHKPGPTNDARNFHVHILYNDRPGTRDATGAWTFGATDKPSAGFPWGTEKPAARLKRLEKALAFAPETGTRRKKLEAQIDETRGFRPAARSTRNNKNRPAFPWGLEAAPTRAKRLQKRIVEAAGDSERVAKYSHQLAEVEAWKASPPPAVMTVGDVKFVRHLRKSWRDATNRQLEAENIGRRYSPESYKALGIDATPSKPLGTRAAALEKQGIATPASEANTQIAIARRIAAGETLEAIHQQAAIRAATNRRRHAERQHKIAKGLGRTADELAWRAEVGKARHAEYLAKPKAPRNIAPAFRDILSRPLTNPAPAPPPPAPVAPVAAVRERVIAAAPAPAAVAPILAAVVEPAAPAVVAKASEARARERVIAKPASIRFQLPDDGRIYVAARGKPSTLTAATVAGWHQHGELRDGGGTGRQANATAGSVADARARVLKTREQLMSKTPARAPILHGLKTLRTATEAVNASADKLNDLLPGMRDNFNAAFKELNEKTKQAGINRPVTMELMVGTAGHAIHFNKKIADLGAEAMVKKHQANVAALSMAGEPLKKAIAAGGSLTGRQITALSGMHSALTLAIGWIPNASGETSGTAAIKSAINPAHYMPAKKAVEAKTTEPAQAKKKAGVQRKPWQKTSNQNRPQSAPAASAFIPPQRGR